MAPPNDLANLTSSGLKSESLENLIDFSNGKISVKGVPLLSEVPSNVFFSPFSSICQPSDAPLQLLQRVDGLSHKGGFLGFDQTRPSDRLMNSLGKFKGREFVSIFRFKTWWSTMWVGNSGSDIQMETQWVMLNVPEIKSYVVFIPIIEGSFRSALYPGADGQVLICAESGSTHVKESSFDAIAYVHVSNNPYNLMKEAYAAIRVHLNTFRLLEEKPVTHLVDKFGWCTWDAFYLTVDPTGIWNGLNDFAEGGISPRFLIIDDGWQSINMDDEDPNQDGKHLVLCGTQMTSRLYKFEECEKFKKYKGGSFLGPNVPSFNPKRPKLLIQKADEIEDAKRDRDEAIAYGVNDVSKFEIKIQKLKEELDDIFGKEDEESGAVTKGCSTGSCKAADSGMKAFTRDLKTKFKGLDDVFVWHALAGAWGGVRPGATHLNSNLIPCKLSPGLDGTMDDLAVVKIIEGSIGLVHPNQADDFFDSMHSYLSKVGITGVKVDVMHTLEYVSEEYGGRVDLAKAYYKGLTNSLIKNFKGTGLFSSMQQCNDFFFLGTKQNSIGRVGDDFWFQDPNGDPMGIYWLQGVHMIHCAYNSMWMGQIIQPDWDMFQSDHLCAKFHAGSRAICGGPVYVSDSVGGHNFDLIKQLVYPDGTIPRCQHFALPTRDCIFKNSLFDGKTVLKIWNLNKYGGVIGAFNCQGAGWDPKERRIKGHPKCYKPMSTTIHVSDVEWDQKPEAAPMGNFVEYIVYLSQAEQILHTTTKSEPLKASLQPSTFELFSFIPLRKLGSSIKFAPIGLTNMFNSSGTIQHLKYNEKGVELKVKGGGSFLAYSNVSPKKCVSNGMEVEFEWNSDGKLGLDLPWNGEAGGVSHLDIIF
ncbi:stachyose synthase-like [Momordica charantia]|uniref:Stachyose synthase-like n=1 Tax=Momordica charantia TaxID=3673 RepID=A0A6J1D2W3_MOMCH|nr:stachyose synthase-like [Momordica charantia]